MSDLMPMDIAVIENLGNDQSLNLEVFQACVW